MIRIIQIGIWMVFLAVVIPGNTHGQYVDLLWDRIAHYPMAGDAGDISGNDNHGLVSGARLVQDRHGHADHAYYFDGVDDRIFCGYGLEPISSSITVSCWIRFSEPSDYSHLISRYDYTNDAGFILGVQDGFVKWSGRIGSGQFITMSSVLALNDDQWHHVVVSIDDNIWSIYVDGNLDNRINTGSRETRLHCREPLTIGFYHRGDGGDHRYFTGYMDNVILYKRPLNACEIKYLFSGDTGPVR